MSDQRFILEFRPLPDDIPAILRLRKLLKFALRQCKLKCEDHREVVPKVSDGSISLEPSTSNPNAIDL